MIRLVFIFLFFFIPWTVVHAKIQTKAIEYAHGDLKLKGHLAWDDSIKGKRPGVLVVHEPMNQIGEMRVRNWWRTQEDLSRVSKSWSRAFKGVDAYTDPQTGQAVELPTGFKKAWSDGMGGYILSSDH